MKPNLTPVGVVEVKKRGVHDKTQPGYKEVERDCYTVQVYYPHAGVDRPNTFGWHVGEVNPRNKKLAERLVAAVNAQKAAIPAGIFKDSEGETFVKGTYPVRGRCINADLKSLGF